MEQVTVLSRNIIVTNREDREKYPLSVLRFVCPSEMAARIREMPNGSYNFCVLSYEIMPYDMEIPFTLYSDAVIVIDHNNLTVDFENTEYEIS